MLAGELEKRGVSCWIDKWNLIPGDPWQPAIEQAVIRCDVIVVFVGPRGLGPWQNEEMLLAIKRRVHDSGGRFRVIPVLLPGAKRVERSGLPTFLAATTWVEFHNSLDEEEALHRLVSGIKGTPPDVGCREACQLVTRPRSLGGMGRRTLQATTRLCYLQKPAEYSSATPTLTTRVEIPKNAGLIVSLNFLKPLVRQEDFTLFSDQDIKIGQNWHQHIQASLSGAKAVVLLISPAFLASDYIANSELPVILKNAADHGARIFPILISPSVYKRGKYKYPDPKTGPQEFTLASIQAANAPSQTLMGFWEQWNVMPSSALRS